MKQQTSVSHNNFTSSNYPLIMFLLLPKVIVNSLSLVNIALIFRCKRILVS